MGRDSKTKRFAEQTEKDQTALTASDITDLSTYLANLTDAEVQQLQNIGSSTISADDWEWLAGASGSNYLLATATVDLQNGDSKTTVYTVSTGKSGIVTSVVIRNPTDSLAGGTDFDIGDGAGADTWVTAVNLSTLTDTTDCIIVQAPSSKFTVFDDGDEFGIIPVAGATADAQATMDVFGYEF